MLKWSLNLRRWTASFLFTSLSFYCWNLDEKKGIIRLQPLWRFFLSGNTYQTPTLIFPSLDSFLHLVKTAFLLLCTTMGSWVMFTYNNEDYGRGKRLFHLLCFFSFFFFLITSDDKIKTFFFVDVYWWDQLSTWVI